MGIALSKCSALRREHPPDAVFDRTPKKLSAQTTEESAGCDAVRPALLRVSVTTTESARERRTEGKRLTRT